MELVIALVALMLLAALSIRFGLDSTPPAYLPGHPREHRQISAFDIPEGLPRALPVMPALPLPTLREIDQARGAGAIPFIEALNAAYLEQRARELTTAYWGESPWLTGHISSAQFNALVDALERERQAGPEVQILVAPVLAAPAVDLPEMRKATVAG